MAPEKHHTTVILKPDAMIARILPPANPRPGVTYIPSCFVLPFSHRGKDYAFHNLTRQCIEGRLPASAKAGEGYNGLIKAHYLVPEDRDECAYYNSVSALLRAYRKKRDIGSYTILPTLACNARCVYCYEEGMEQRGMTPETVEQTIRFIRNTCDGDRVRLHWFGGEPLLGVGTIDRICEGVREAGLKYRSGMISNGSLITPEIVGKMKRDWHLGYIQISMDGAEEDYILRKNYRAYHDDYHTVMKAVSLMAREGIRVTIRCNVDEENWKRIPRFLEELNSGVAFRDRVRLYFCPLNALRQSEKDTAMWEKILDADRLIWKAGFRPARSMELSRNLRVFHCMADCGSVVITPDGSLYPCEHCPPESRFGDIWNGTTNEAARESFCRTDRMREKCRGCPFLPECTGFAACPVEDLNCREVREMMALNRLRHIVDRQIKAGREKPSC